MLKKSSVILSSCNGGLQNLFPHQPVSKTSSSGPKEPSRRSHQQQCRTYAMIADGPIRHRHEHIPWPEVTSAKTIPTPYQIFNQKKGSPYSKLRFYELVKLYHPDRHIIDGGSDSLPYATKLERYRLVVAANNLLSDPVRRGAYDVYGAGWNGQPDILVPEDASAAAGTWGNYSGRGWRGGPGGPSQNATWEDWERWYQRDAEGKQEPAFFSNSVFVSLIIIFAALGGIGQATRAGNSSTSFLEQTHTLHDEMSRELRKRRKESTSHRSREERIRQFLQQRDPFGYDVTKSGDEHFRKLLPTPEPSTSGDVQQRPMDTSPPKEHHRLP